MFSNGLPSTHSSPFFFAVAVSVQFIIYILLLHFTFLNLWSKYFVKIVSRKIIDEQVPIFKYQRSRFSSGLCMLSHTHGNSVIKGKVARPGGSNPGLPISSKDMLPPHYPAGKWRSPLLELQHVPDSVITTPHLHPHKWTISEHRTAHDLTEEKSGQIRWPPSIW